jgi:hypothetical protein
MVVKTIAGNKINGGPSLIPSMAGDKCPALDPEATIKCVGKARNDAKIFSAVSRRSFMDIF